MATETEQRICRADRSENGLNIRSEGQQNSSHPLTTNWSFMVELNWLDFNVKHHCIRIRLIAEILPASSHAFSDVRLYKFIAEK